MTNTESIDKLLDKAYIVGIRELRRLVKAEFKKNEKLKAFYIGIGTYCFSPDFESKEINNFIGYYDKELHLTGSSLVIKNKEKIINNADRNIFKLILDI